MSSITLLALGLTALSGVQAQNICYNRYGNPYRCNDGGLGYGARIGIGVGIAAGKSPLYTFIQVLIVRCSTLIPTMWLLEEKRRFAHHKPPPLPYAQNGQQPGPDQGYNPYTNNGNDYSNNPPPPQFSFQQTNSYGPQAPAQTYQPSMANNYRAEETTGNHEHGYEWEQAREAERLEREGASGANAVNAPPAYDPTNVGTNGGSKGYAPPAGAPPK